MNKLLLAVLTLAIILSANAFAEEAQRSESQSKLEIKEINGQKNKVSGDIDEEIQNAKLRAESGSKSKWSASVTANYKGGAISSPFNSERPNLSGVPGVQTSSSLGGAINARYRTSKTNSFTAGMQYAILSPFNGSTRDTNFVDPVFGFNHVQKMGVFQTVATVSYAYGTSQESKAIDETHQLGASFNTMHDFGNGLSAGALVAADWNYYLTAPGGNRSPKVSNPALPYGHDRRTAWDLGFFPQAEYKMTDRYSLRTVFGYFNWRHLYGDPNGARLLQTYIYQSLGFGIAVTRDVFVYPNVQFVPDNIRSDFTNFAVSTTINIF